MLTQEPMGGESSGRRSRPVRPAVALLLTVVVVVVLVLRHDYWNWRTARPLLFGFLPVGLWWQGLVSILACLMMWLMVRFAWPGHIEEEALEEERKRLSERKEH